MERLYMNDIKNDTDTEVVAINGIGICENCRDNRDDLLEVTYTEWKQVGEYMTPTDRTTDVVCDNCFQEYY